MLLCLQCAAMIVFKLPGSQDLFSSVANLVAKVAAPARQPPAREGKFIYRSLYALIPDRIDDTMSWQWKWINALWPRPEGLGDQG